MINEKLFVSFNLKPHDKIIFGEIFDINKFVFIPPRNFFPNKKGKNG